MKNITYKLIQFLATWRILQLSSVRITLLMFCKSTKRGREESFSFNVPACFSFVSSWYRQHSYRTSPAVDKTRTHDCKSSGLEANDLNHQATDL